MAIFDAGSPAFQQTTGSTTAVKIWSGTAGALASISPAVTVRDLVILNTGTVTVVVGGSNVATQSAATQNSASAMLLPAGAQMTIQGWSTTTDTVTNDVWGIAASGTFNISAGLATVASVV